MSRVLFEQLTSHSFSKIVVKNGIEASIVLDGGKLGDINAKPLRNPNEYEYYVIEAGRTFAHLLGVCEQMIYAVRLLSTFSPTKKMKEIGINRSSYIQYNIENYLIRTQSLNDRVLKLTNAVFHLGIDQRNCKFDTISKNLHIRATKIPGRLQKIWNLLGKYRGDRNMVIHHESYQEKDLTTLEMYYLAISKNYETDFPNMKYLPYHASNLAKKLVNQKNAEFDEFNSAVFTELGYLFDELEPKYLQLEKFLRAKYEHIS